MASRRVRARVRVRARAFAFISALTPSLCFASPAGSASYPPFLASFAPCVAFASRGTTVTVYGLNFLPGGDAACVDCNAAGVDSTRCAFAHARGRGTTAVFTSSDPSAFTCALSADARSDVIGFARGAMSANDGVDWAAFGGAFDVGGDGAIEIVETPVVDVAIGAVSAMGIPLYVAGKDFRRVAGCVFEHADGSGAFARRAVGTPSDALVEGGMFISSALMRCESPVYELTTTPTKATLARVAVSVLGDGERTSNEAWFKDNYWLIPGSATIGAASYGFGGEIVVVVVGTSDGDGASIGCLIGTTRVSARSVATGSVVCVAPARALETIANVPVLIGSRHSETFASSVGQSTETVVFTQTTPVESATYEIESDDVVALNRGGQVLTLSSAENFVCALTTVVNGVTSVLRSTVANPSPFVSSIYCSLPMDVFGGFVALGITGGTYEGLVQVMYADPPRAQTASPRRSPSGGGGIVWVYGTNLDAGVDPRLSCVFSADDSASVVVGVDRGARVSSALVACEIPPAASVIVTNNQRTATVSVVMRDTSSTSDALDSGATIEYAVNVLSATISPVRGSIDGGTPVRLDPTMTWVVSSSGSGTPDTDDFGTGGCRFSAVTVAARVADTGAIECVSPSMGNVPIDVPVAIVVDWRSSSAPLVLTSALAYLQFSYARF